MQPCEIQPNSKTLFWQNPSIRNPLLFSAGIHILITLIVLFPTSLFHFNKAPEIYSVELIDLTEPQTEPEPVVEAPPPPPIIKPKPIIKETVSTKPILSTRNIPQTPTEIKILRPRKVKKDLRIDRPPIDQTMVLAALQKMKHQEKEEQAQLELDKANEAARLANQEAMQALRESILRRQPNRTRPSSSTKAASSNNNGLQSGGQRANTVLTQYIATIGHHISEYWRLPEGQKWDPKLKTTLIVKIKDDGIVISSKIFTSSKSKQFDKFVIETIEKSSPLPPIPSEITNKPLKLHFFPQGLQ